MEGLVDLARSGWENPKCDQNVFYFQPKVPEVSMSVCPLRLRQYRLFGAVPGTFKEVSGTAAAPTPVSEFANQSLIQSLVAAPSPKGSASCPLILCKVMNVARAYRLSVLRHGLNCS